VRISKAKYLLGRLRQYVSTPFKLFSSKSVPGMLYRTYVIVAKSLPKKYITDDLIKASQQWFKWHYDRFRSNIERAIINLNKSVSDTFTTKVHEFNVAHQHLSVMTSKVTVSLPPHCDSFNKNHTQVLYDQHEMYLQKFVNKMCINNK